MKEEKCAATGSMQVLVLKKKGVQLPLLLLSKKKYACVYILCGNLLLTVQLVSASVGGFPHVLLLLVKVPLIVFFCYGLNIDMSVPFSHLVALGKSNEQYKYQQLEEW